MKIFNKFKFSCSDEIKNLNQPVIQMNLKTYEELKKIKNFLFEKMYTNKSITEELNIATSNMSKMFEYLLNNPLNLPKNWHYFNNISILELDKNAQARLVCDYISGMTDNYFNF